MPLTKLLSPKQDFIFKKLFGSPENKSLLISFLNAVLQHDDPITDVNLVDTNINKEYLNDKYARLDIKAITDKQEYINIEIQVGNEYNIGKRSMFYWSEIYTEQLQEGQKYNKLKKTICINVLDFIYSKLKNSPDFHNKFELFCKKAQIDYPADILEIHFIELPKLPQDADINDLLVEWSKFLNQPEEIKQTKVKEIARAKDQLLKISGDPTTRQIYKKREETIREKLSALDQATQKGLEKGLEQGIEQGIEQGEKNKQIEIAKNLLDVLDTETIAQKTGLTIQEIKELEKK